MENNFLNAIKSAQNMTSTENGAGAYHSTMNSCLDLFGALGGMRTSNEDAIISLFSKAFYEDRRLATKMLFYFRDIRGGQGTRRQFRIIVKWLAEHHPEYVINNFKNFLEYGRGDDFLCLLDSSIKNQVMDYLFSELKADYVHYKENKPISLLAKWMPSENASSSLTRRYAKQIISYWKWTPKQYRKLLSTLRAYLEVTEVKMSSNNWDKINYSAVPAKASLIYSSAFERHDEERYLNYLSDLSNGNAKVNAKSLYPVDIVQRAMNLGYRAKKKDILLTDAMWKALPDYFEGKEETGICVVDVSGSMSGLPMQVAISLGLYCADKCKGPFEKHFITFSANPRLESVIGDNITTKVRNMQDSEWGQNTDLEKVFDLILSTAIENKCSKDELPKKLYIISDMQFDAARGVGGYGYYYRAKEVEPFMQTMKEKYSSLGYEMPSIVYWNVRNSKCGIFQETFEGENCCMVSGYSPSLFKSIMDGTTYEEEIVISSKNGKSEISTNMRAVINPLDVMRAAVENERYDSVWTE